jgi:iron complex outermembrane receptor protein
MRYLRASTALAGIGMCMTALPSQAQELDPSKLLSLSLEELGNVQVTSVSKRAENESEAAAAIYVISQKDIQRSGLTSIPELLRMVPGLSVAQSGSHQWSVSSRGLSGQFADTLLVLIDGRSVYTPLFSGVYWDIQDTPLQDVERIEVIRGPGATLWGANAVNGVINIITKNAKDTQGGFVSETAGTSVNSLTTARYGAKIGDNAYFRTYAKYDDYNEARNLVGAGAHDEWNKVQSGFRADWKNTDNQSFTIQGDIYDTGESALLNLLQSGGTTVSTKLREDNKGGNILGRWDNKLSSVSNLTVQMYYDDAQRENLLLNQNIQTFDADMQHVWSAIKGHEVVWGAGYRLVKSDFDGKNYAGLGVPFIQFSPPSADDNLLSAFAQDKITLLPSSLFLTLGSKFEHNDFTGFEYQPSARLSWLVDNNQTIWTSVSRAVRTPNIGGTTGLHQVAAPTLLPGPTLAFLTQVGNANAKSEDMVAYELGYRIQPRKNISVDTSIFYNNYSRMIIGVAGTPTAYGALLIVPISPENIGKAHTWGGEMSAKWNPTSSIELATGYSLLQMKFEQVDPLGYNFRNKSPQHSANARATFQLPHNLELTTSVYVVDELAAPDPVTGVNIDGYTRFDMRLAWKPMENLEVSLVGQNLLDDMHQEFGGFAYQNNSQIPRSVYGNITWKF